MTADITDLAAKIPQQRSPKGASDPGRIGAYTQITNMSIMNYGYDNATWMICKTSLSMPPMGSNQALADL